MSKRLDGDDYYYARRTLKDRDDGTKRFVIFVGAAVGAKNEALFPGRVPHVRQRVHGPKKMGRSPFNCSC